MSLIAVVLAWAVIVIVSILVVAFLARRWGRDPFAWILLTAVLGPLTLVGLVGTHQADVAHPEPLEEQGGRPAVRHGCVLLATDGSPSSVRAARYVAAMHPVADAVAFTVFPHEARPPAASDAEHRARVDAATGETVAVLRDAGVPVRVVVGYGVPGEEIVRAAGEEDASVVVLGRRGAGLSRALLGSVSEHVVRHAKQPVVVVD